MHTAHKHSLYLLHTHTHTAHGQTDRQIDRHTERQTDRQTDGQTNTQAGRQTDRQIHRQQGRDTDRQTDTPVIEEWGLWTCNCAHHTHKHTRTRIHSHSTYTHTRSVSLSLSFLHTHTHTYKHTHLRTKDEAFKLAIVQTVAERCRAIQACGADNKIQHQLVSKFTIAKDYAANISEILPAINGCCAGKICPKIAVLSFCIANLVRFWLLKKIDHAHPLVKF